MTDKPKLGLPKKKVPSIPAPPIPLEKPFALDIYHLAIEELARNNNTKSLALEAMMKRITNDDELFRRIAMPLLHKRCLKSIHSVIKQMEFQRAVAKAIENKKEKELKDEHTE
jgi:hypothetical protein